jgi:hypothetical protein
VASRRIADDDVAARERRRDHLRKMLSPRREHQQRFRFVRHRRTQEEFAQRLTQ